MYFYFPYIFILIYVYFIYTSIHSKILPPYFPLALIYVLVHILPGFLQNRLSSI